MKESSEINMAKQESYFEKKIMNKEGPRRSLMKFLGTHDILKYMPLNKNIQARMPNSSSFRTSSMYVDYLNCLQKILDGTNGDMDDKTFCDIANKVYESDLGGLCESLLSKKTDEQKYFNFNIEKKEIDPLLEPCLKIYMMHMILLDLLSITEKDFKNCDVAESSSIESVIIEIINKRQRKRIEKIFDIILNKEECEVKTFWDELKMVMNEKKYNELQVESENEFRDVIHLILFRKIFKSDKYDSSIQHRTKQAMDICKNKTLQGIERKITEKEGKLRESQQELEETKQKIKDLEDKLDKLEKQSEPVISKIKEIELEKDQSDEYFLVSIWKSGFKLEKSNLSNKLSEQQDIEKVEQESIRDIQSSIADLKDNCAAKKMLDKNSKFVESMHNIASNWLGFFQVISQQGRLCYFSFLLNHPDRISSFNFDEYYMIDFISYLLRNHEHEYFYLAIIQTADVINKSKEYFYEHEFRHLVNAFRNWNTNINIDFIENILLDCHDKNSSFSTQQLRYVNIKNIDSKIDFLYIFLSLFALATSIYDTILYAAMAFGASWALCPVIIYTAILPSVFTVFYIPFVYIKDKNDVAFGWLERIVIFFTDYSARKKRRIIYDRAISQLNECKQRTKVYKTKLTKQKNIFDKYLQIAQRSKDLKDSEKQVAEEENSEIKNEEEITT